MAANYPGTVLPAAARRGADRPGRAVPPAAILRETEIREADRPGAGLPENLQMTILPAAPGAAACGETVPQAVP